MEMRWRVHRYHVHIVRRRRLATLGPSWINADQCTVAVGWGHRSVQPDRDGTHVAL